jgi:hypothetical protein
MNSNILGKKGISFSNIQEVTLSKSNVKAADIIPHGKRRIISRDPGETLSSEGVTFMFSMTSLVSLISPSTYIVNV